jgi:hypothetical protein
MDLCGSMGLDLNTDFFVSPQALVATWVSDSCQAPKRQLQLWRSVQLLTMTTTDDDVALCVLFAANGHLERRVVSNVKMRQVGDECAIPSIDHL